VSAVSAGTPRRSLLSLWLLIAVFALPAAAAWFFYLNPEYLPSARSNRGELIQPPVALSGVTELSDGAGRPFDGAVLEGKWTLVGLFPAPCDGGCRETLIELRQIRLALGESRLSVERLLILGGAPTASAEQDLQRDFPGLQLAQTTAEPADLPAGRVHILDPHPHLPQVFVCFLMRYHLLRQVDSPQLIDRRLGKQRVGMETGLLGHVVLKQAVD